MAAPVILLAVALSYAFTCVSWKPFVCSRGMVATLAVSVLILATVWSLSFFVVLSAMSAS
jgi:hypothetical protein